MKDIEDCKKCEWAHKQPGIIFCPFCGCLKDLEEKRQEFANKLNKNREDNNLSIN